MTRVAAACGALGLAGNLAAVALLADVPSAYRPGDLDAWLDSAIRTPVPVIASAWAFTLGLVALVPFARALPRLETDRPGLADAGAWLVAAGALINAAACPAVAVAARFGVAGPAGRALLGHALFADAVFNVLLGAGMIALALGLRLGVGLRALGLLGGVASLPVGLQYLDDRYANLLALSGPLWLLWFLALAVRLWRAG